MLNKKGDMGIGTLILFIAFILVAAVAAGVLISTTAALQSKALSTGKATTAEVGTSMTAIEVYAEDATAYINGTSYNDKEIDYFYYTIKLASGSDPVRFEDLLLTFNTDNQSSEYTYATQISYNAYHNATDTTQYNTTLNCGADSQFYTYNTTTNNSVTTYDRTKFGITYSLQSANSITGYMVAGDVVKLCFVSPRAIAESEDIKLSIVPKVGSALVVKTTTPGLMIDKRIYIFP